MNGNSDLTISNQLTWTGGTIQRTGLTTLGPAATWQISGRQQEPQQRLPQRGHHHMDQLNA